MTTAIRDTRHFKTELGYAGAHLVVVDFQATWCPPCKHMSPILNAVAREYGNRIVVLKVDVDRCDKLAKEYNVKSMPTFMFFKNNKLVEKFVGADEDRLYDVIEKWV